MSADDVERAFREEHGRAVAVLVRAFGDLDVAEEAVQDAFAEAVRRWPVDGPPPSPAGWIITTARNRAIDRLRREGARAGKHAQAVLLSGPAEAKPEPAVGDDRLRLLFTCCHPVLGMAARVALTLRMVGGLSTAEIARAFLVPERTMAQRLVRAKARIREARVPYRVPEAEELPGRLAGVLAVVYLVFNEGYRREATAAEAIRLGRVLLELLPDEPEVRGLLGLMLLVESRRAARVRGGELVLLADQDPGLWDGAMAEEGRELVRWCLRRNRPGPYQVQAAINAVHSRPPTDWRQVLALYDQLMAVAPSPVVALNRAVAVAEVEGVDAALPLVEALDLDRYYLFHAIRADLLRRSGRDAEAAKAYGEALARTQDEVEIAFLERRRLGVLQGGGS
ncbi:sigma-70 family RNA polymerase sigma factor [Actinomadura sp. NPDC048394]|uniref:RNA polymerase sigma factor n=1 Tax=Actinomadura sp. NPDC048394 TaxID=3158223 RepID=UPI0033DD73B7